MMNFNRVFPKLHMEHLTGSCTEPFNCKLKISNTSRKMVEATLNKGFLIV